MVGVLSVQSKQTWQNLHLFSVQRLGALLSEITNCLSFYNLLNRAAVVGVVFQQHPLFLLRKELLCFAKLSSYLYSSAPDAANKNAADFKFAYIIL